ncbi:MAG: hypothetical protein SGPRY_006102 [Prymnesium sp.]
MVWKQRFAISQAVERSKGKASQRLRALMLSRSLRSWYEAHGVALIQSQELLGATAALLRRRLGRAMQSWVNKRISWNVALIQSEELLLAKAALLRWRLCRALQSWLAASRGRVHVVQRMRVLLQILETHRHRLIISHAQASSWKIARSWKSWLCAYFDQLAGFPEDGKQSLKGGVRLVQLGTIFKVWKLRRAFAAHSYLATTQLRTHSLIRIWRKRAHQTRIKSVLSATGEQLKFSHTHRRMRLLLAHWGGVASKGHSLRAAHLRAWEVRMRGLLMRLACTTRQLVAIKTGELAARQATTARAWQSLCKGASEACAFLASCREASLNLTRIRLGHRFKSWQGSARRAVVRDALPTWDAQEHMMKRRDFFFRRWAKQGILQRRHHISPSGWSNVAALFAAWSTLCVQRRDIAIRVSCLRHRRLMRSWSYLVSFSSTPRRVDVLHSLALDHLASSFFKSWRTRAKREQAAATTHAVHQQGVNAVAEKRSIEGHHTLAHPSSTHAWGARTERCKQAHEQLHRVTIAHAWHGWGAHAAAKRQRLSRGRYLENISSTYAQRLILARNWRLWMRSLRAVMIAPSFQHDAKLSPPVSEGLAADCRRPIPLSHAVVPNMLGAKNCLIGEDGLQVVLIPDHTDYEDPNRVTLISGR